MLSTWFRNDLTVRAMGALLFAAAAACWTALFHDPAAARGAAHWSNVVEAAYGFLGGSAGLGMVLLGSRIHDRISVSSSWS